MRWFRLPQPHDFEARVFSRSAFAKVEHPRVVELALRLVKLPPTDWQSAALAALPPEEPALDNVPEKLQEIVGVARDLGGGLHWDGEAFGP